jgi:LmbE family N-acetylglucosaminyl deacetylase
MVSPFGRRILVLVPHPDDEVVGVAAAIARARADGARLFALYLGHGCLSRETLWPWQRAGY